MLTLSKNSNTVKPCIMQYITQKRSKQKEQTKNTTAKKFSVSHKHFTI